MPVQVEDRLPAPGADVHEHAVVLETRRPRGLRDEAEHARGLLVRERADIAEGVDVAPRKHEEVRLGRGRLIATKPSAVWTWSPSSTRRQNRQLSGGDGKHSLLGDSDGPRPQELADLALEEPRRVVVGIAAPRAVDQHAIGRPTRPCHRRRERSSERARRRALRSFFTGAGTESASAVAVPGRGEYGKTWRRESPARPTTSSVRVNASSSSPGKPTMTSAVRLNSASGSSLATYWAAE